MVHVLSPETSRTGLMQGEQRGAKEHCSGTTDNLLTDCMVCQDSQRERRNLSIAWIDVKKAYDSVDHPWLELVFSASLSQVDSVVIMRLSSKWNTKIAVRTVNGRRRLSE